MKQENKPYQDNDNQPVNERTGDLQDSPRDKERLQPDEATLDLPDVKDIPGQENIHPPALGELADTTISSADEEGAGLLDDTDNDTYSLNKDSRAQNDNSTQGNP